MTKTQWNSKKKNQVECAGYGSHFSTFFFSFALWNVQHNVE